MESHTYKIATNIDELIKLLDQIANSIQQLEDNLKKINEFTLEVETECNEPLQE